MIWELTRAKYGSARLDKLLAAGWEPFSVLMDEGEDVVYVRRSQIVVVDAHVRIPASD